MLQSNNQGFDHWQHMMMSLGCDEIYHTSDIISTYITFNYANTVKKQAKYFHQLLFYIKTFIII